MSNVDNIVYHWEQEKMVFLDSLKTTQYPKRSKGIDWSAVDEFSENDCPKMGKPLILGRLLCSYCGPVSLLFHFELVMVRYMLQLHNVLDSLL